VTGDPLQYEPSAEPIDTAPRGYLFLSKENEALLRDTLTRTGVELGEYDDLILRWLATWEFGTVAVVASWIARAARFGSAKSANHLVHDARAKSPADDADGDNPITPVESPGARYASAKQTRAALRRRQDASGTGRGPDDVAQLGRRA
jgi:hypothetical protein